MHDYRNELNALPKRHDFLICVDSDGTVFDTMAAKHRCFRDSLIQCFGLRGREAEIAAEVWAYVNLHSIHRGKNRFRSLLLTMDLLRARGVVLPGMQHLRAWTETETQLGNPALCALLERNFSEEMDTVFQWSRESDAKIAATVHGVPPFPLVRETLEMFSRSADILVVSHTPCETLVREWTEHGIGQYVIYLAGQECGSKTEHIRYVSEGKYPAGRILTIGDSPGDRAAAEANHALFFPIFPGREAESWRELSGEGKDRFFCGVFTGLYQENLLNRFRNVLLNVPPWETDRTDDFTQTP